MSHKADERIGIGLLAVVRRARLGSDPWVSAHERDDGAAAVLARRRHAGPAGVVPR